MRGAGAALGLCLLAGCASAQWTYSRLGLTPARLDLDLEFCRRQAQRPDWFALSRSGRLDQDAVKRCMERKGYTAGRDE